MVQDINQEVLNKQLRPAMLTAMVEMSFRDGLIDLTKRKVMLKEINRRYKK